MDVRLVWVFSFDTGIFVALRNANDDFHGRSKELMKRALKSEFGRVFTSDYIVDEAVTTALVRTKKLDLAVDLGEYVIESPRYQDCGLTKNVLKKLGENSRNLRING